MSESPDATARVFVTSEELVIELYETLKRSATEQLRNESTGGTLQPTALVHEAYLRLNQNGQNTRWDSHGHFFVAASRAMRRILIERARSRNAQKRFRDYARAVDADLDMIADKNLPQQILDLHDALDQLSLDDPQKGTIVEMKFFGGLSNSEIAKVLAISDSTVKREWRFARAWLMANVENRNS